VPPRALVAFPRVADAPAWARVLSARGRFDPLVHLVPPHLTLVFPFEDTLSDAALDEHVLGVVARQRSFAVTLQGITAHEDEYLFLNVKRGNDELIQLHDALYRGVLAAHRSRRRTFVPHVTIGRVARHELEGALAATAELASEIHATVESVSMLCVEADQVRQVFESALQSP